MKTILVTFEFTPPEDRNAPPDGDDPWGGRLTGEPVPISVLRGYIIEALETWGGQRHPADPLFDGIKPRALRLAQL